MSIYILIGGTINEGAELEALKEAIIKEKVSFNWGDSIINELETNEDILDLRSIDHSNSIFLCDDKVDNLPDLENYLYQNKIPYFRISSCDDFPDPVVGIFSPPHKINKIKEWNSNQDAEIVITFSDVNKIIKKYHKKTKGIHNVLDDLRNLFPPVNPRTFIPFEINEFVSGQTVLIKKKGTKAYKARIESINRVKKLMTVVNSSEERIVVTFNEAFQTKSFKLYIPKNQS